MSKHSTGIHAFTLIELLIVLVLIGVLGSLLSVVTMKAKKSSRVAKCTSQLRNLGGAILLYSAEQNGTFPRSWHSAGAHGEPGWARSIAPYLGIPPETIDNEVLWKDAFNRYYRSPVDRIEDPYIFSYGLNVYFELDPSEDYTGSPQTWRLMSQVGNPSRTILLAQTRPVLYGDHIMAHFWQSTTAARNALQHDVYNGRANYLFVDGSVRLMKITETYNPASGLNLWNPSLAR